MTTRVREDLSGFLVGVTGNHREPMVMEEVDSDTGEVVEQPHVSCRWCGEKLAAIEDGHLVLLKPTQCVVLGYH